MSFIQPCFIRKNTPELRKKLEDIGLKLMNSDNTTLDCHNYDGAGHHRSIEEGRAIITYYSNHYGIVYDIDSVTKMGRIDAGTNEDLFLALAALRDDTDKNQWFTDGEKWVFCPVDNVGIYWSLSSRILFNLDKGHKATVEELIEHFADEDYKQRYKQICDSEQFKEIHKSLGENIKVE